MNIQPSLDQAVPKLTAPAVAAHHLDVVGDFAISVGGVLRGDVVGEVSACNGMLTPKLRRNGARVTQADGWQPASTSPLPFAPGSVDLVFAFMVLHHMNFPSLAITELQRTIKPGGRLVITDVAKYDNRRLKQERQDHWMGFYPTDIRHWLEKAGFSNIIVNPVPFQLLGIDAGCIRESCGADIFMATGTA